MNLSNFYDRFHKSISSQKRIISDNNYTYSIALTTLKEYMINKKLKILDYGCGSGTLSFYYASKGHRLISTDISKKALRYCQKSANYMGLMDKCKFIDMRILMKDQYNNFFDLIICSEVIEHIKNDKQVLNLLFKKLRPGGIIYITTPSVNAPLYKLGLLNQFDISVGHIRRYTINSLATIMENIGYSVIQTKKIEGIIRNSLFTLKIFNPFVRFIKGPLMWIVAYLDENTIPLFGESNILILAKKV